jgi:hypothetical protein
VRAPGDVGPLLRPRRLSVSHRCASTRAYMMVERCDDVIQKRYESLKVDSVCHRPDDLVSKDALPEMFVRIEFVSVAECLSVKMGC